MGLGWLDSVEANYYLIVHIERSSAVGSDLLAFCDTAFCERCSAFHIQIELFEEWNLITEDGYVL
jgi:hypothetical protein